MRKQAQQFAYSAALMPSIFAACRNPRASHPFRTLNGVRPEKNSRAFDESTGETKTVPVEWSPW